MAITAEQLKARLIAAQLTRQQFFVLRNTVDILRLSGAPLTDEQKRRVEDFERVVHAYREANG